MSKRPPGVGGNPQREFVVTVDVSRVLGKHPFGGAEHICMDFAEHGLNDLRRWGHWYGLLFSSIAPDDDRLIGGDIARTDLEAKRRSFQLPLVELV